MVRKKLRTKNYLVKLERLLTGVKKDQQGREHRLEKEKPFHTELTKKHFQTKCQKRFDKNL